MAFAYRPIISHKRRYIYFYIPKVACTTIRKLLAEDEGIPWYPNWTVDERGKHLETPFKRIPFDKAKDSDYLKFGFVRNPWARLVSCYVDKVVNSRKLPDNLFVKNGEYRGFRKRYKVPFRKFSFADFVDFVANTPDANSDGHFRSQHTFFASKMDEIGKIENLSEDLGRILSKVGIEDYSITKQHSTKSGDYHQYYNKDLWQKVKKRFSQDVEQFRYTT